MRHVNSLMAAAETKDDNVKKLEQRLEQVTKEKCPFTPVTKSYKKQRLELTARLHEPRNPVHSTKGRTTEEIQFQREKKLLKWKPDIEKSQKRVSTDSICKVIAEEIT